MDTPRYQELQEKYYTEKDERQRIDLLVEMALEVRNLDAERALEMSEEIIQRSLKAGYRLGEGRGLNMKGWCNWQLGDYDEGLEVLRQANSIAKELKNRPLLARVYNNLGYIYRDRGELANALNYFERALAINEKLGDEVAQSVNLASIAYVHFDLGDYDHALEYALKCLPIFEKARDAHRSHTLYHILGNIYFKREEYPEALSYFEANLNQSESDTALHVMAESGIGKVYYKMDDQENAKQYLSNSLAKAEELANVEVQIVCHYYLGRMYMDDESYRKALRHMNAALALADEYTRRHDMMSVHEGLSLLYDKMGDIPKAFYHLKAYEKLKEEIFQQTTFNQLRNLQARQQIELAQKEKEVAEQTANLKQQFMANMSHEIRTPMNAIVGMTRLLLGKDPKPEQLRYLEAIRLSADNLLVIINDILDLSKIEAGKIVIENTDFSPREVIQSVRDILMFKAEEKQIDLRIYVDAKIPKNVLGDPTRLNQVLINLAGNAVKFTDKGYVEIRATLQKEADGKTWIQFDITDTGIGIGPEYVGKIFDSFTQAGSDVTRKFGGTGLGLTISKQLVNLMHGNIDVRSTLGAGTTFSISLPFEVSTAAQQQDTATGVLNDATLERLNHIRILLVEDNEFNRMVAEDTLKELMPDITIDIAVNGEEAVQRIQDDAYDIVLMDIQMPVMDGVTATRKIRKELQPPARDVKIIAMTANVLQEDVQQYFKVGMDAYVSKPFQTDELLLKMASLLNAPFSEAKALDKEQPVQQQEPAPPPLPEIVTDMQFLRQFTSGNPEKMQKYIGMFLENAPRLLGKIDLAMEARDLSSVKIAAHSLKPQLSYMGVKEDVSHIFLIEQTAGETGYYEKLGPLIINLKRVCEKAFAELAEVKA